VTSVSAPPSQSVSPTAKSIWITWRPAVVAGLVIVLVAVIAALASAGGTGGTLDPLSADPTGSRALATLLRANGVDVVRTQGIVETTTQAHAGDTLLVISPELLSVEQAEELRSTGADLVVVGAERSSVVKAFAPDVVTSITVSVKKRDPVCDLQAAVLAGSARVGGTTYAVAPGSELRAIACYPTGGHDTALLATTEADGRTVTFLGAGAPLENDRLGQDGNAALSLDLLGAHGRLVWAMSSFEDIPVGSQQSFTDLLPPWVGAATLQLIVAVLLLALWRARRLGPVVDEQLPVVVRATETTEGRARLYRRAKARGRAANQLRQATLRRLLPLVGLSGPLSRLDPGVVSAAVAERTGRSTTAVTALLYGGAPRGDGELVSVANDLDALEREVRRT
jgi:hypothetical protein